MHGVSSTDFDPRDQQGLQDVLEDYFTDPVHVNINGNSSDEESDNEREIPGPASESEHRINFVFIAVLNAQLPHWHPVVGQYNRKSTTEIDGT